MARTVTPLTDIKIKTAKAKEKEYTLADGGGLQVRIMPNGTKSWRLRYKNPMTQKQDRLTFGTYPSLTLVVARKKRDEIQELLAKGIDPKKNIENEKQEYEKKHINTFYYVASEWIELKKKEIKEGTINDIWRSFELHIFPTLKNTPISDITAPLAIEILKPIEKKGSLETVKRLCHRLNEVMIYANNSGMIYANPLSGINKVFHKPTKKHNPYLSSPEEVQELMHNLSNARLKVTTRLCVEWTLHTITRTATASGAKWEEIDLENKLWVIPISRMKMTQREKEKAEKNNKTTFKIPLTPQMLQLLDEIHSISGNSPYLFPSDRNKNKPANPDSTGAVLRRMGYKDILTAHGMRATASTILNAQGFEREMIEVCLSHKIGNEVSRAYNHHDYLKQRRPIMEWWSNFIEEAKYQKPVITTFKNLKIV